jgi:hypothetical protein
MKTSHWAILAAMVGALALQLAGIDNWSQATSPKFVAGALASIATTFAAMFNEKPINKSAHPLGTVTSIRSRRP